MSRGKTRVVVNFNGADRALFSVRENANHDLTVLLDQSKLYERPSTEEVAIREHRFSVHVSPDSPGTTIVQTLALADGSSKSSALYIKDSKESLFGLVFGVLCPDFAADKPAKIRAKEPVVRVGTFQSGDMATLIYHVIVCDLKHTLPLLPGHSLTPLVFRRWKIGVYCTYVNMPSDRFGRFYSVATRPPRTNGEVDPGFPDRLLQSEGADSLSIEALDKLVLQMNNQMSDDAFHKSLATVPDNQPQVRDLMLRHRFMFHPSVQSLFAERLGAAPWQKVTLKPK